MAGGRPKGSINKKSRALIQMAEKLGISPMEVMLDNMRVAYESAKAAEQDIPVLNPDLLSKDAQASFKILLQAVQRVMDFRGIAQSCAAEVAPYIHPRLSAVDHSGEITTTKVIRAPEVAVAATSWQEQHSPHTEH